MEKYTYTIPLDQLTGEPSTHVIVRSDGAFIPTDPLNSDYQEYLNPSEAKGFVTK